MQRVGNINTSDVTGEVETRKDYGRTVMNCHTKILHIFSSEACHIQVEARAQAVCQPPFSERFLNALSKPARLRKDRLRRLRLQQIRIRRG
jgi:hypothetical protein